MSRLAPAPAQMVAGPDESPSRAQSISETKPKFGSLSRRRQTLGGWLDELIQLCCSGAACRRVDSAPLGGTSRSCCRDSQVGRVGKQIPTWNLLVAALAMFAPCGNLADKHKIGPARTMSALEPAQARTNHNETTPRPDNIFLPPNVFQYHWRANSSRNSRRRRPQANRPTDRQTDAQCARLLARHLGELRRRAVRREQTTNLIRRPAADSFGRPARNL